MSAFPRYALYYVPPPNSALYRFGAETIGYDAFTGQDAVFPPEITTVVPDWHDIIAEPRKYGFHATLKAPFALQNSASEIELVDAFSAFCDISRASPRIEVGVATISDFIALIPAEPSPALMQFAAEVVEAFDSFRAPLTPEDRARRNPAKLTERQATYLDRWGYPYVMDEFRFHMTLTGRLDLFRRSRIEPMLSERFRLADLGAAFIDRISICRQDSARARFRVISQNALRAA